MEVLTGPLVDGHCHRFVAGELDEDTFARWCTESAWSPPTGVSYLDSAVGLAVRRWCPPALGLPAHVPLPEYLSARATVGWREASRLLLRSANLSALLVDTGLDGLSLVDMSELGELAAAPAYQVVRLERLAESLGDVAAADFSDAFRRRLAEQATEAVAWKSIAAYRHGLDLSPRRPTEAQVQRAAAIWLRRGGRLTDEVLLRFLLWCGVDTGLPLQLHCGFGDPSLALARADPSLLQPFLEAVRPTGVAVVLLHCYPYHRQAGWLAAEYPHVYVDVGLTIPHVGVRAEAVLAEYLELAPFGKLLYSSDGYGLPELYCAAAAQFRHALGRLVDTWLADDAVSTVDAQRLAAAVAGGNARRVYGLG